jgi:hypothetical protein
MATSYDVDWSPIKCVGVLMSLVDRLLAKLSGSTPTADADRSYWFEVRCDRCGETLRGRIDMRSELSARDDADGFLTRKTLIGGNRCFNAIETVHYFDASRRLIQREIQGGRFADDTKDPSR